MLETFETVERTLRLHGDDLDPWIKFAQTASRSHQRPVRAQPRNEMSDLPRSLLDDLGAGAVVMRERVGRVVVLVGIEVLAGVLLEQSFRFNDRAVAPLSRIGQHQLRS